MASLGGFASLPTLPEPVGTDLADVDRAWGDEMVRRSRQIATGEVGAMTWDEVLALVAESRQLRDRNP